jgi:hypothetical protein
MAVNGRTCIDGSCRFDADKDGSFRVFGTRHFAYVTVLSPGVAEASWNEDPPTSSVQAPLGGLRRNGACWESPTVQICAWQLGGPAETSRAATSGSGSKSSRGRATTGSISSSC